MLNPTQQLHVSWAELSVLAQRQAGQVSVLDCTVTGLCRVLHYCRFLYNSSTLVLSSLSKCADFTVSGLTWCRGGWDQSGPMRGQYLDHVITLDQSESRGGVGSYEGRLRLCALCLGSCPREPRSETSSSIQDTPGVLSLLW